MIRGDRVRALARRYLPAETRGRMARRYDRLRRWPPVGQVRFGSLRRQTPISANYGFDRGKPIDRHYIEAFLTKHARSERDEAGTVRGRVLEIAEPLYAPRLAAPGAIDQIDILDLSRTNQRATIVADLANASALDSALFDCVICTQTLHLIYDLRSAIATLERILRPGGTLLATVPGISQICRPEMETSGDYWRFTTRSTRQLFEEAFEPSEIAIEAYGNVLTAAAFLYGLCVGDLKADELEPHDPNFELIIGVKAVKMDRAAA